MVTNVKKHPSIPLGILCFYVLHRVEQVAAAKTVQFSDIPVCNIKCYLTQGAKSKMPLTPRCRTSAGSWTQDLSVISPVLYPYATMTQGAIFQRYATALW